MKQATPQPIAELCSCQPWYEAYSVALFHGECTNVLEALPQESVDCIFADPPYRLSNGGITCHAGRMVSVDKGEWDRSLGVEKDYQFALAWLQACRRVLTADGTIWVSGTNHNIFAIGHAMQVLGFRILNDIVWFKPNAAPNLSCRYFTHSHETLIWAAKSHSSRHRFNYEAMRALNRGKQMRSVWEISAPRPSEKAFGKHPTQKPLALLERILLASTLPKDLVLDPFVGSGTTCVAAIRHGRRSIGIDSSLEYLELARLRLEEEIARPSLG
jgi:site-specific DNA-methyltransferase (adenine-specific)